MRRLAIWTLLGLLAVGLRVYHLGTESIWLDEATSIETAHDPLTQIPQDAAADVHPPLYYLILHGWVRVVGDSERAVRGLSVVFSLGAILAMVVFARRWLGEETARLAALLAAVSPLQIQFAQEARMYALLTLLAVVSTDAFLRWIETGSRRAGVVYVLAAAAMLYTHAYAAFVLIAQATWVLASGASVRDRRGWYWRAFLGFGLTAIVFLPWVPTLFAQVHEVERGFWIPPSGTIGRALEMQAGSSVLVWIVIPAAGWAIARAWRGRRLPTGEDTLRAIGICAAVAVAVIAGPYVLSRLSRPVFLPKYTIAASPAFLLLAASGLSSLPRGWARATAAIAIVGLTILPLHIFFSERRKDDWRQIAASVEAQAQPGDLIVYSQAFGASPFRYYARRTDLAQVAFLDEHAGLTTHSLDVLADVAVGSHERVWLVTSDPDETTAALQRRLARGSEVGTVSGGGVSVTLFAHENTTSRGPDQAPGSIPSPDRN